jgi:hypothetical protein
MDPLSLKHTKFITRAKIIHGDKYEYTEIYRGSLAPITIKCPIHGDFQQKPKHHLVGKGCKHCGKTSLRTHDHFLERAKSIHDDKYEYIEDYKGMRVKMRIQCLKHGIFRQNPNNHILQRQGCPQCAKSKGVSRASLEWLKSLNIPSLRTANTPEGEYRIPGTSWKVDGYDPITNTVYEYHGYYWHGHPNHKHYDATGLHPTRKIPWNEVYAKTVERDMRIVELGYTLIVKWEEEE